jgi:hypothetical protein
MGGYAGNDRAQQDLGDVDYAERLLLAFDLYPGADVITADQIIELYEGIKKGEIKPDMIGIDNVGPVKVKAIGKLGMPHAEYAGTEEDLLAESAAAAEEWLATLIAAS